MKAFSALLAGIAALALAGCTVHTTEAPSLSGPSGLALSLSLSAIPDSISQDGGSQSSIKVTAIGPTGKGQASLALRVDTMLNGVAQDIGTLSARTIVTNNDGVATVVFTAPPPTPGGITGTCQTLPGTCVTIAVTPIGSGFDSALPQTVSIRLVPIGVILPPAGTPTAQFTFTPTPVNFNIPVTFDASKSCPGAADASGNCQAATGSITSYQWTFGDGGTASGRTATHTYVASTTPATSFTVTLTVTNDRGISASASQIVTVAASAVPTGDWVLSPTQPSVGDTVIFNADGVRAAAGHSIVQYSWNFGDGGTGSGALTTHVFTVPSTPGSYNVVLTVVDDVGAKTTLPHQVTVTAGGPSASFSASVTTAATHTMTFDGSASTGVGTATIVSYQWAFGDGTFAAASTLPTTTHSYSAANTYTVTLTVTDSLGRTGRTTSNVTVP